MMHTTCAYCSEHSSVPEMDDGNWDLSAVVRSCRPSPPQAEANSSLLFPPHSGSLVMVEGSKGGAFVRLAEVFEGRSGDREILEEQLHVPFFLKVQTFPQQESGSWSAISAAAAAPPAIAMEGSDRALPRRKVGRPLCQTSRSRRRKIRQKKVVQHVAAEGLSSDLWSWRKYGQKPIKGSPYPRGYYKCSSSKGCPARKLVERSRMDPTVFIVTYTAEHNHPMPTLRNSLAGRTRHKLTSSLSRNKEASPLLTTSGPELSPTTHPATSDLVQPKQEEDWVDEEVEVEEDDDEGELLMEDMVVMGDNDLLFASSEEGGTASAAAEVTPLFVGEGCCEDDLFPLQWLSHCNIAEAFSAS